jgi:hypothetical protein
VSDTRCLIGLDLSFFLQLCEGENSNFVSQLGKHEEDSKPAVYFSVRNTFATKGYIVANFGKDFGKDYGIQIF